jgi:hypothetical protein
MIKLPIELDLDIELRMIVQESISNMLCEKLSLPNEHFLKAIDYLPTYRHDKDGEKVLNNLYIKLVTDYNFNVIGFKEIEKSGATWQEVIEFLLFSGSRKIKAKEFYDLDIR